MKALLLSAGLGTRLKPFTDHHPKALASVNGRSLLEWNIRNLQYFGIREVVVNVHHFAEQIIEVLEREQGFGSKVHISDERDAVLETGGGLKKAAPFFAQEQDFLVMNVDILTNADISALVKQHRESGALATLAVQQRTSSRYFLFDADRRLRGWENVQSGLVRLTEGADRAALVPMAFSGLQVLHSDIFAEMKQEGKFSLVDVYLDLCGKAHIRGWDHSADLLLDVGKPESLERAAALFSDAFPGRTGISV